MLVEFEFLLQGLDVVHQGVTLLILKLIQLQPKVLNRLLIEVTIVVQINAALVAIR